MKALLIFSLVSFAVLAECKTTYDYQSGNFYRVCNNDGYTTLSGNNYASGSNWSQRQNDNGTYSGRDSQGNYYSGNSNTGAYYNTSGRKCYGKGNNRVCF